MQDKRVLIDYRPGKVVRATVQSIYAVVRLSPIALSDILAHVLAQCKPWHIMPMTELVPVVMT